MLKFFPLLIGLIAINNILSFTPGIPMPLYYGSIFIIFTVVASTGKLKFNGALFWMVIISILSIWINPIPTYFKAEERLIAFIIGLALFGPLFYNEALGRFRIKLLSFLNFSFMLIVFFSFIGKLTGVYPGIGRANIFQGITNHSMLLAPISAVSLLYSSWKLLQSTELKFKIRFSGITLMSFFVLLLAGSRGSLIGGLLGFLILLLFLNDLDLKKIIRIGLIAVIFLSFSFPYWSSYTETLNKKMEYGEVQGDLTATRSQLWNYRKKEFLESPFFGIGFANSKFGAIDKETGIIEPGTTWGVIFAQIGLFGSVPFLILCIFYWVKIKLSHLKDNYNILLLAILSFLFVHWVVEGYMLASGSFLFLIGWLVLGVIDAKLRRCEINQTTITLY